MGDPERAKQLASLLKEAKIVSNTRGYLTYTGLYRGERITVATHGIGMPSAAIVFEELRMLGARSIVRLGTAGAMTKNLSRGDFLIPTGAAHSNGSLREYAQDGILPPVPDFRLTSRLMEGCKLSKSKSISGLVYSTDVFYSEDHNFVKNWTSRGIVGVDMECATLFTLGSIKGFKSAALLIISDNLVSRVEKEMFGHEQLRIAVGKAGKIVLDALSA